MNPQIWKRIKEFYSNNNREINKGFDLAERVSSDISDVLAAPKLTAFSWIKVALKSKKYLSDVLDQSDIFNDINRWDPVADQFLTELIIHYVQCKGTAWLFFTNERWNLPERYFLGKIKSYNFGWKIDGWGQIQGYISKGMIHNAIEEIREELWHRGSNLRLNKTVQENLDSKRKKIDVVVDNFTEIRPSKLGDRYFEYISRFKEENLGRSHLLWSSRYRQIIFD